MRGHGQANLTVLSLFVSDLESTSHCLQGGRLRARLGRDCDKGYKGSFGEACLTGLTLPCVVPATQAQDTCTILSTARTNASPEGRGAAHRNDILRRLIQKTWFRICSSRSIIIIFFFFFSSAAAALGLEPMLPGTCFAIEFSPYPA